MVRGIAVGYDSRLPPDEKESVKGTPMPWVVGIDEAGYGPNLGPLVQTAVSLRLPDADPAGWDTLHPCVRRAADPDDGRVCVDDSKKVYAKSGGLGRLERGVFAALGLAPGTVGGLLAGLCDPGVVADLRAEAWFAEADAVPQAPGPFPDLAAAMANLGVRVGPVAASLVPAPIFNRIVAGSGTKATVLTAGLVGLLRAVGRALPADEPVLVLGDQLGGRRFYSAVLQAAFPDGWVVTEAETAGESRYRVDGLGRPTAVVFRPRADADGVSVALASMLAKYLRELCMGQFNRYWRGHVADLKPTAGYPGDAKRFLAAIRPAMDRLGTADDDVWRVK